MTEKFALSRLKLLLVMALTLLVAACSGDSPTNPQQILDPSAAAASGASPVFDDGDSDVEAGSSRADASDDPFAAEFGDFSPDEIDLSDIEYDGEDGPFEHIVRVQSGLELVFRFNGRIRAREEVSITLRVPGGGTAVRGKVSVDFGDGRRIKDFEINRKAELTHTYREPGRFRIFVVVEADDGRRARGGFRLVVHDQLFVTLDAQPVEQLKPGEEGQIQIMASTRLGANRAKGELTVNWGDGTTQVIEDFVNETIVRHMYEDEGEFEVILLLEVNGREFVEREILEVIDGPGSGDEFDLRQATVMGNSASDVATWAVTSQVTSVSISPGQICIYHTKAGQWPVWQGVEGNPWVVANIGGGWYAGTYEWVRPGQVCKGITAGNIGPHIKFAPMHSWRPRQGEVVYLFMSTLSRLGARSTNERSNVVRAVWTY